MEEAEAEEERGGADPADMILTYRNDKFVHGTLYYRDAEFVVLECRTYRSLQVERFCYDNIVGIRLHGDPGFDS